MVIARVACALALVAIGACKDSTPDTKVPATPDKPPVEQPASKQQGWYRARLIYKNIGDLPFFLQLPPAKANGKAQVQNGEELTEFKAEWRDNEVTVTGQWNYTSVIEAELKPDGSLTGTWTRDTPLWGAVVRDFVATPLDGAPDPTTRFAKRDDAGAGTADVTGTWEFKFEHHEEGEGILQQGADKVVRGFIKPGQLGDIRTLAGNLQGDKLSLSHFNGNAANLVLADVAADGKTMSGVMSMQNVWNEKFTAKKVATYELANKVKLKTGEKSVTLRGLDKYKGKPTLAIIFATWCSSCNDATPYFKELYAKYHARGLEIFGVAYDLSNDEKANLAELDYFRKKYDVPWELLQVPCTPETWASVMPPELEGWDGLPILLLVRPDGTVQTVFGGWFGPATGREGEKRRAWFETATKELVDAAKT